MDFDFTPEEEAFRAELRAFLDDELPTWWKTVFVDDARAMPFTRELCQKLAARGWLTLSWPREHGGADGSVWQQAVVREEMWAAGEPRGPQYMNLNYIGPLIMRFGTPEQQARHLPRMAAGDVLWCQGFSEPEAGSDLASLKTRAVRISDQAGDRYVVNGQKIWNSYADAPADFCLLLARTNPEVKKQQGISMFLVDMRTPGITVRPIPSMAGKSEFSEIFFDDAAIPAGDRLGDEDAGWTLVGEGLAFERIGIARYARANRVLEHLVQYANETVVDGRPLAADPAIRMRLATLATRIEAAKLLNYGAISIQAAGEVPAIEASIARIHNTQVEQLAGQVGLEVLGPQGLLVDDDPRCLLDGEMQRQWLESIPVTVAAGTTEVQKNIIAQRGLGLPRSA
jgi:alkylation response protein AidB-like acyl-CoA dehydrogenase